MATDEEPPGPLDLSLSILSTDLTYGAESVSVDTALSMTPGFRHTPEAVATATLPLAESYSASHYEALPPGRNSADDCHSGNLVSFLKQTTNARTRAFRRRHFPEVSNRDWNDWRWQTRHRIRTLAQLEKMLRLSAEEREALVQGGTMLPVGISPYYMSLLDGEDALQPLRRTVVPTLNEFVRTEGEADDPLGEDSHSPVPGLVHRYPDRTAATARGRAWWGTAS
jgi:lysine 2,3-aminomutase